GRRAELLQVLDLRRGDRVHQGPAQRRPGAAQRVDRVIGQVSALRVFGLQLGKPYGDLIGLVDLPFLHTMTIANPIVMPATDGPGRCIRALRLEGDMNGLTELTLTCAEGRGLEEWAASLAHRPTFVPRGDRLRFAFYGRVSTEDHQDPVTSRARQ